ncbi:uncharacterized protein LOC129764761 [Toxorhynchites rutilus septentrionalis]|uniref:uncharacterized protein LOC129764761 n=1 Tax=Toxorhynchites rutilus septentrionalis TaxID=329112 RepID=UPI0024789DAF|nr:uncharacterized protein LOC129764761 [Toxorhynchites rutilus septentrionalis]
MLPAMMYQHCLAILMITHCLSTHQSPPSPSSSSALLKLMAFADDRTILNHRTVPPGPLDPDSIALADDSSVATQSEDGRGSDQQRQPPGHKSDSASNRNALHDDLAAMEKNRPPKQQRTTAGSPTSAPPSPADDGENPWHTPDLAANTNPSTQRSFPEDEGSNSRVDDETVTSSSSDTGGLSVSSGSASSTPPSVPSPQHQHQTKPQQQQQPQQQRHRTINSMNLNPTTPAMVVKPVDEHRKLLKSTGPILNYVFDSHPPYYKSNYYNTRYGPHFETDNVTNITVQNGDDLFLSCRISLLQDKTVSWVRRKHGETDLQLLTVGKQTYSGDSRYTIEFQYPNNWRLKIAAANKNDEGVYECQISTHPPKVIIYNLHVNAPEVLIVDEEGEPLYDKYYEVGSTIKLMCRIRHMSMLRSAVYWIHNENILNHDVLRGGISVKTNLTNIGANSTLFVAKVNKQDSGSYTCSIGPNQHYSISVHVLNGTANPYGIYQRSCAFSVLLEAVDLKFILKQLLFLLLKCCLDR